MSAMAHWFCDACESFPHTMDCPALAALVARKQEGFCPECNAALIVERDGLIRYCPNGHVHERRGEAVLELLDASGSGWIREALESEEDPD